MFLFFLKPFVLILFMNNEVLANVITDVVCSLSLPPSNKVSFYLYTKYTEDYPVTADKNSIENAPFNMNSHTLKVIAHGFGANSSSVHISTMRKAYLSAPEEYNILMVDYYAVIGEVSESNIIDKALEYTQAVECYFTFIVTAVADMIEAIQSARSEITVFHLTGHSLGGHIVGEAGNTLRKKGKTVDRVTALDPAGPGFSLSSVTPDSARFVDAYHTQIANFYGDTPPVGTVDFYVNNAVVQDGCANESYEMALHCSHSSAVYYFADSINNKNIIASRCDEIKELINDVVGLYIIDENNDNVLSSTCSSVAKSNGDNIVFGEHVSLKAKGLYFVKIAKVPNSS